MSTSATSSSSLPASLVTTLGGHAGWATGTDTRNRRLSRLVLSVAPVAVASLHLTRRVLRGDAGDPTGLVIEDRLLRIAGVIAALRVLIGLSVR